MSVLFTLFCDTLVNTHTQRERQTNRQIAFDLLYTMSSTSCS